MLKKLLKSRTVWLALAQGVVGILIAVFTELDMGGLALLIKSLADIWLRVDTTVAIAEK